ncbi:Dynein light chain 1 [Diplonema papillatum]|nr:Dynein light chain 1 [Diplonema papillatum]
MSAVVRISDMVKDMEQFAISTAHDALDRYNTEKDVASHVKKEFDRKHGPTWHVFVGRNFGSQVTHELGHYIYFYLGQSAFLIFKSG